MPRKVITEIFECRNVSCHHYGLKTRLDSKFECPLKHEFCEGFELKKLKVEDEKRQQELQARVSAGHSRVKWAILIGVGFMLLVVVWPRPTSSAKDEKPLDVASVYNSQTPSEEVAPRVSMEEIRMDVGRVGETSLTILKKFRALVLAEREFESARADFNARHIAEKKGKDLKKAVDEEFTNNAAIGKMIIDLKDSLGEELSRYRAQIAKLARHDLGDLQAPIRELGLAWAYSELKSTAFLLVDKHLKVYLDFKNIDHEMVNKDFRGAAQNVLSE